MQERSIVPSIHRWPTEQLGRSPPFDSIPLTELDELARTASARRFGRGDAMCRLGAAMESLVVVVRGAARFGTVTADGRAIAYGIAGHGTVIGLGSLLGEESLETDACGLTDGVAVIIPRPEVLSRVERSPPLAMAVARTAAAEARSARARLIEVVTLDVSQRLARRLLELGERFGRRSLGSARTTIALGLTQQDLADLVGAARESVSKALRSFAANGLVASAGRGYVLIDPIALAEHGGLGSATLGLAGAGRA